MTVFICSQWSIQEAKASLLASLMLALIPGRCYFIAHVILIPAKLPAAPAHSFSFPHYVKQLSLAVSCPLALLLALTNDQIVQTERSE